MSHYKPYPAYKDSGVEWIGPVPAHWIRMPFKRLAMICNGQDYKDVADPAGDIPVIGSGGEFARASRPLFNGESVLLGRKGTIDKPLYMNGAFWPVDTMFYTRIDDQADGRFVYYAATTIPFDRYSTNTALPSMTQEDLSSHVLVAPGKTEQSAIAAALDRETARIDALIAKKTRFIELLKEKRQALITHAVTKGLDPKMKMKDSGVAWIGEVPEHWALSRLGHFACVENGTTPSRTTEAYWVGGNVAWLGSGEVNQVVVTQATGYITEIALRECSLRLLPKGTVVVGMVGQGKTRGLAAILDIEATINQNMAAVRVGPKLNGLFLLHVFTAAYEWLREGGRGSNQAALNCELLGEFRLAVPPAGEQQQIVTHIAEMTKRIDSIASKTERSITLLKERRSALITAAVTGQIDLREGAI